jgi:hypothetical protein
MQQIAAGHEIGQALCEALGLPTYTRLFDSRCAVDKAVIVRCEYFPRGRTEMFGASFRCVRGSASRPAASGTRHGLRHLDTLRGALVRFTYNVGGQALCGLNPGAQADDR